MKIRIIKVCAPFINFDLLGKVSNYTETNNHIYLTRFNINISKHLIEYVNDSEIDINLPHTETYIYNPFKT
jgi:hypothetical protein